MVWLVAQSSDKVSTLSLDIQKKAREWFGIKKHIAVIPLGIEFIEHKKKTKDELGLDKDAQYLISVGRLIERKGYRYLLKAVSMLPARVELLIIGEGPQKSSLAKLAHELNSGPRVHFLGRLSEEGKFAYLDASDIYVMSSLHEGFGIVLLEAMYCELPLVSTACGGAEDIILENQSGLLCKAADAQDLARKIMILIEDSEKRKRYGRKGRELCNSYHIAAVSQRYIQFLEL
jgi:glycosyltransferase involved in cell wall biosynthesis